MGTAYVVPKGEVQEQRPAPLRHAHVQAFRNRCVDSALALAVNDYSVFCKVNGIETIPCTKAAFLLSETMSALADTTNIHQRRTCTACHLHQYVHGGEASTCLSNT